MHNVLSMCGAWMGRIDRENVGLGGFQHIIEKRQKHIKENEGCKSESL